MIDKGNPSKDNGRTITQYSYQKESHGRTLARSQADCMMATVVLLHVLFVILLFISHCFAQDRGPEPTEFDKRTDDVLMKTAPADMLPGKWFSFKEGLEPTIISKTHISWPGCETTYSIVQSSVGKTFPDNSFPPLKIGRYVTVKLKISQKKCISDDTFGFIQFSFMTTDPEYSFAAVVQYDIHDRPNAWYDLRKLPGNKR